MFRPLKLYVLEKSVKPHHGEEVADIVGRKVPTLAGWMVIREYARSVCCGHPDKKAVKRYKGTALGAYLERIKDDPATAEYWAR
jgi:hypothetical protein